MEHCIIRETVYESGSAWGLSECGKKIAIAQSSGSMDGDDVRLTMCQDCEVAIAEREAQSRRGEQG